MKHVYQIKIEGMMCQHCVAHVGKALNALPGAEAVDVNLEAGTAALTASAPIDESAVCSAVEDAGYTVLALEQAD